MECGDRNCVSIGGDLIVKFEIGEYGKFVRLQKKDKWINLSAKAWNFLLNNISMLSKTFDEGSDYGVQLTESKTVKVGQFRGQTYLSLRSESKVGDITHHSYINLNKEEWETFLFSIPLFNELSKQEVQYSSQDTDWHFMKDAVKQENMDTKYRLVPRMIPSDEVTLLYAYLIAKEIKQYIKDNCLGCSYDAPDQLSHMGYGRGCLCEWSEAVLMHYRMFKKSVCLDKALDKLNGAMKWELATDSIDKDKLYKTVMCYDEFDSMPIGYNSEYDARKGLKLAQAYVKLFEYLSL